MSAPSRRILLVDDEEFVRTALRRALRREPYEFEEAEDPAAALRLLEERSFDVILADHLMPGMNGLELLGIAKRRWPDTIRIMLTGHADTGMAIDAINQGEIYRFLTKPWDDLELKVTLFNAFERLDLERENRRLLASIRRQDAALDELGRRHPGIGAVQLDASGAVTITEAVIRLALGRSR